MDITNRTIWQVAAGDTNRKYADLCLEWDVVLNGPGSPGPWPGCRDILRDEWKLSPKKLTDLKRFAEEIKNGDVVVLRMGTTDVLGVGVAIEDYEWHQEFGDIDGWYLEHVRRVRWLWKYDKEPMRFSPYSMKLGDTVQLMESADVKSWLQGLDIPLSAYERILPDLPPNSTGIDVNEISEFLFYHGVASHSVHALVNEIDELSRIARWYQKTGKPSEAETVAYLVIPLLRVLGWTPQKMALQWRQIDVALFSALPRAEEQLSVVVEAKKMDESCLTARSQAQSYAESGGRSTCRRLIVTDGLRYGVYLKKDGVFPEHPAAYLNLTRMRTEYPVLHCQGAKQAFLLMSSDWSG